MVGNIDKDILGKEVAFDKLEGTTFERSRMIKELEAELEVVHMGVRGVGADGDIRREGGKGQYQK